MSRVPKQDLEALKAGVDQAQLIGATVALEKRGQDLAGAVPVGGEPRRPPGARTSAKKRGPARGPRPS